MRLILALLFAVACLCAQAFAADVSATANIGQIASFTSTVATGTTPFTYQWRKDGVAIAGATAATYERTITAVSDAGSYDVVVSNSAGSSTSANKAVLSVNPPVVAPSPATVGLHIKPAVATSNTTTTSQATTTTK